MQEPPPSPTSPSGTDVSPDAIAGETGNVSSGQAGTPGAPDDVSAVDIGTAKDVMVTWTDAATDLTGGTIQRETLHGSNWSGTVNYNVGPAARSFQNAPGLGTYRYRIAVSNTTGMSDFSRWTAVTVSNTKPRSPYQFEVAGPPVKLSWLDNATNESGYEILRELQSGSTWVQPTTLRTGYNVSSYSDNPPTGSYRYRLRAVNSKGASSWVGPVLITVGGTPPPPPTGLSAADAGNRRALLGWTDNSSGAASFEIDRSPAFSGGLVQVSPGVTGYVDACGAGSFSYRVRATNNYGPSAFTGWASVTVADTPPAAPSGLGVADAGNQSQTRVTWVDNSDNETSFKFERDTQQASGAWGGTVTLSAASNSNLLNDSPGLGTFRYRACAANSAGSSAWTAYVTVSIGGGWTVFNPSADTRMIYVSAAGSDSNNGLSQTAPKRSIAAGYALLRTGYPDWLLLKAGDVWNEIMPTWSKSGRSSTEPMLVGSYGSGARPRIQTGSSTAMQTTTAAISYIAFSGLNFVADTWTGSTSGGPTGPFFVCAGGHWIIEDCLFERYANNLIIQGWPRLDDVKLRRNIFWNPLRTDAGNTNMYIDNTDNLVLEENLMVNLKSNDSLTNPSGTKMAHNAYLHESNGPIVVIGNIAYNARTNITVRPGGFVRDNLAIRAGQGFQIGWDTDRASTVVGNVITESRNHHNGQPLGQGLVLSHHSGSLVANNVIANSTDGLDHYSIWFESSNRTMEVKNNVSYNWWQPTWEAPLYFFNGAPIGPINIHNNDMQQVQAKLCNQFLPSLGTGAKFASNRYYTTRTGYCGDSSNEYTFSQWKSMGEPTAINQQASYPAPNRSIGSYNSTLGGANDTEAFLIEARKNSRSNWRPQYTAHAVNEYIRAGFGVTLPPN